MNYRNHSITNVGAVRNANEDNFGDARTTNGHVFVVCDGMGGHVGGAKASSIAVASILEYFQKEKYSNLIQAIDRSLSFANEQIFAHAMNEQELKGMGTTAVILLISGEDCYIGHVGDSRIYLKSSNHLHRVTKDHSFVQTLVDSGVISDDEAENHPKKNQILKALGIAATIEGTICHKPIQVKRGDTFLLCSDGLNGMVNDQGLEMMLQSENIQKSGDDLIRAALDAGGHDNLTATIVTIDQSTYNTTVFVDFNPVKKFNGASTQVFSIPKNQKTSGLNRSKILIFSLLFVLLAGAAWFFNLAPSLNVTQKPTSNQQVTIQQTSTLSEKNRVDSLKKEQVKKKEQDSKPLKNNRTESPTEVIKEDGNPVEMKSHIVEKNQTLKIILESMLTLGCKGLTLEKIKEANKHQSVKIKAQMEQENTPITKGTKLNIPCEK